MSSEDDDSNAGAPSHGDLVNKRRKVTRACDPCRRRKIKCDAPEKREGEDCTSCALHTRDCTFVEGAKKRGPPIAYVRYLENRVDRLEDAIKRLSPTYEIESNIGPRYTQSSWINPSLPNHHIPTWRTQTDLSHGPQPQTSQHVPIGSDLLKNQSPSVTSSVLAAEITTLSKPDISEFATGRIAHDSEPADSSGGEEGFTPAGYFNFPEDDMPAQFSKLQLGTSTYHGKSSNFRLLNHAMSIKNQITGRKDGIWQKIAPARKARIWEENNPSSQVRQAPSAETLRFPPQDLSDALIALYFQFFHPFFPTLHRPSFEALVKEELHKKHITYGLQFLLVCAVGSRWSTDPRVCETPNAPLLPGAEVNWKLAGWPYFSQVMHFRRPFTYISNLPDLQSTVLLGSFGLSCQARYPSWLVSGHGARCAVDLGAHRRKAYPQDRPLQNEIWKRTFWCLVNLDRMTSSHLGRPPAINDEDIDVDLPLDANDDSWDESLQSWNPSGSPSRMQYFILSTKLIQIIAFTMRTVYSINRSRAHLGLVGEGWERRIVSELDSALNSWADSIPDHLRWDPNIADPISFNQAVSLNLSYRHAQIIIHRRFLPGSSKKPSELGFTSLAVCTNAARSISHIADTHLKWILAGKHAPNLDLQYPATVPVNPSVPFLAGVVLLISMWEARRSGGKVDMAALADDMQKLLRYIEFAEERDVRGGVLLDTLRELASVGDIPLDLNVDDLSTRSSQKRTRAEADDRSTSLQRPQDVADGSWYQEPSFSSPTLSGGMKPASSQTQPQSHSVPSAGLPTTAQPFLTQTIPSQRTNTRPTVHLSNHSSQTPGSHLPRFNPAIVFAPISVTTTVQPVGSSDITRPSDSGLDVSETARIQESFNFTSLPPANIDTFPSDNALETAYNMLMGNSGVISIPSQANPTDRRPNMGGVDTVDPAAAAYFRVPMDEPEVNHNDPHQVLQQTQGPSGLHGDGSRGVSGQDYIPQHLQPMVPNSVSSPAGVDWDSWIDEIWGLYEERLPT